MDEAFVEVLHIGSGDASKNSMQQRSATLRGMAWSPVSGTFEEGARPYPGLNMEEAQPVLELRSVCHSPMLTFFYFVPKSLWVMINEETNRYCKQRTERSARKILALPGHPHRETLTQIRRWLMAKAGYQTHEILHVVGLLVARMLCPQKRSLASHWCMTEDGAVPAGDFGRFMARNRCQEILRDLHFVDNEGERNRDKLWKLRPVVDKLQQRLLAGWTLPAVFSFDEGVLPSTSKRNTTRMFMPDKPHRYGSKMFMLCDSRSAYCHRFEMYAGKRNANASGDSTFDHKTGAAAVVRNLKTVLEAKPRHPWHLVVVDRFYSSVLLAIELLGMGIYVIGTIMADRLGYDKHVKEPRKTQPAAIPRGSFLFSRSVAVPTMVAFHWWDCKPVQYLCTGSAMTASTIQRNVKLVGPETVPCPAAVNDYQRWMGGVDVHDQLRLQAFSLQMSTRFTKYYKGLFLGFIDLALVNSYISHKETARLAGTTAMPRADWGPPPTSQKRRRAPVRLSHDLEQSEDRVTVSGVQKRRQRSCKVCDLLRTNPKKKSFATTFFCERCSVDAAKCWLCNKLRHKYKGEDKTCFAIWHEDFACGKAFQLPWGRRWCSVGLGSKLAPGRKTRRELELHAGDAEGGECKNGDA